MNEELAIAGNKMPTILKPLTVEKRVERDIACNLSSLYFEQKLEQITKGEKVMKYLVPFNIILIISLAIWQVVIRSSIVTPDFVEILKLPFMIMATIWSFAMLGWVTGFICINSDKEEILYYNNFKINLPEYKNFKESDGRFFVTRLHNLITDYNTRLTEFTKWEKYMSQESIERFVQDFEQARVLLDTAQREYLAVVERKGFVERESPDSESVSVLAKILYAHEIKLDDAKLQKAESLLGEMNHAQLLPL